MIVVVGGTGTDVGKTFVSCALIAALRRRGVSVGAWKPVASGVGATCPDTDALALALQAPVPPPLYSFRPPVSPHLGARLAGLTIAPSLLVARCTSLAASHQVFVVETAGGLFTPLAPGYTNADLAQALPGAQLVLVAPDRLGVLHDVNATQLAARAAGLSLAAVVLSCPAVSDASTGTNADELGAVAGLTVAAIFPRVASPTDPRADEAAAKLWQALGGPRS